MILVPELNRGKFGRIGLLFFQEKRGPSRIKLFFVETWVIKDSPRNIVLLVECLYTTWKVDGATLMYWFIMAPYESTFWELGHLVSLRCKFSKELHADRYLCLCFVGAWGGINHRTMNSSGGRRAIQETVGHTVKLFNACELVVSFFSLLCFSDGFETYILVLFPQVSWKAMISNGSKRYDHTTMGIVDCCK